MAAKNEVAKKRSKGSVAEFPFYDYLWQFYEGNRREIWRKYTTLTRKFLRFNDPGDDETRKTVFLRKPQYEALEMYVFLKEYCDNARLSKIFKDWQERKGGFEGRGNYKKRGDELALFETVDAGVYKDVFAQMVAGSNLYANYIFALTMGLGKTVLMATCIYYEFLLARKYPKDSRFCHNALVFAPETTVLQSLKEIQTFDKAKVVPKDYVRKLDDIKFHFLDDTAMSLSIQTGSEFNIVITNNQKIILKKVHRDKGAGEQLFATDNRYRSAEEEKRLAENPLAEFYDFDSEVESEDELVANQRFEMLKRLRNLGVYVDEAHHVFGSKLESAFSDDEKTKTSLRKTINELAKHLDVAGSRVVACYNFTGTPYVKNRLLPEVVYTYSLKDSIDHKYLKLAVVSGFTNTKDKEFVRAAIKDFWDNCGEQRVEGMLPKMALFASCIDELDNVLRPAVEDVLTELNIPTSRILRNVGDDSTTNDEKREFKLLDAPESDKQFILLVNKGTEGWNCRSLFAVALHRKPKSKVFVLQSTMRCLRAVGDVQQTGRVYLSEENKEILNDELMSNFHMSVDELNSAGEKGRNPIKVRPVPPPVKVHMKMVSRLYELDKKKIAGKVLFNIENYDLNKYRVVRTDSDIRRLDSNAATKKIELDAKENIQFTAYTLVAEIARYLGEEPGPVKIQEILERSVEGMDKVLKTVNDCNEVLYDEIIPRLFKQLFDTREVKVVKEVDVNLVKLKDGDEFFEFTPKDGLLVEKGDSRFAKYADKTFHLDNYCFDSNPELSFFGEALKDSDIDKVWFTGMLTQGQTEFFIRYIDPETHALRSYYPDFLLQKKDGSYLIVEIKGENKLDDPIVQAKKQYASQIACENSMTYEMIPGKMAGFGLHQPSGLARTSFFGG